MGCELDNFERISSQRKTEKVFATSDLPVTNSSEVFERLLACAGWAPFHKVCNPIHRNQNGGLDGIEPWRFYCLNAEQCRKLRLQLTGLEGAGKIPLMLAAADSLVLVTWLPNPPSTEQSVETKQSASPAEDFERFEPTVDNVEHIAAASAAIQTFLLAATSAGIKNYWSSGGILRSPSVFASLEIPRDQRLLAAIFLFPGELPADDSIEIATSKLRQQRGPIRAWSQQVHISKSF